LLAVITDQRTRPPVVAALVPVTGHCGRKDRVFGRKSQVPGLVDGYVVNVIAAINATRRDTFPRSSFVPGVAP
jgi:hypothetical protein